MCRLFTSFDTVVIRDNTLGKMVRLNYERGNNKDIH
jgi:hypothetical protein